MFESGATVAEYLTPVEAEQVQPNGVDLTVESLYEQTTPGRIAPRTASTGSTPARTS